MPKLTPIRLLSAAALLSLSALAAAQQTPAPQPSPAGRETTDGEAGVCPASRARAIAAEAGDTAKVVAGQVHSPFDGSHRHFIRRQQHR